MADDSMLPRRRQVDKRPWTLDRILITVTTILSIIALIFSMGVNFQKLNAVAADVAGLKLAAEQNYVRRDVSQAQLDSVNYQIGQLRDQVDELTRLVMSQHPRDVTPSRPRFGP